MGLGQGLLSLTGITHTLQVSHYTCFQSVCFGTDPLSFLNKIFHHVQVPTTAPRLHPLRPKQSSRANQVKGRERVGPEDWEWGQMGAPLLLLLRPRNLTWIL